MVNESDDPLAEFRGGEVQIGGISRKIAGHIHPTVFRQISRSATSDQVSGDPHHYEAFVPGERGQEILEIRPMLGIWQTPSYRYLMNMLFNSVSGTGMVLIFSFVVVKIQGRNLDAVYQAIRDRACACIQEYDPTAFSPPDTDAPVITQIEIVIRGEDEELGAMGRTKPSDAPAAGGQ